MIKGIFYAVNGFNAVAVFGSWGQVEYSKKYIKVIRSKRFDTFGEAEKYAFEKCSGALYKGRMMPTHLELDQIVFFKKRPKVVICSY